MTELVIGVGLTILGAILAAGVQHYLTSRKENRRAAEIGVVGVSNRNRVITDEIFEDLSPRTSMKLAKDVLGAPTHYGRTDFGIFGKEEVATHSYIYDFKNAWLKLTSRDDEMIDTPTVLPDNSLTVKSLMFPCDQSSYQFNEVMVCEELLDRAEHTYIFSMRDNSYAVRYHLGPPHDLSTTYFGYTEKHYEYQQTLDSKLLIGAEINGVCISREDLDAYFIWDSELR